jgi:hypothetical protein
MIEWKVVYRDMAASQWDEKVKWCANNLYNGGHYEPNWQTQYPFIIFTDEKEFAWFKLRWE